MGLAPVKSTRRSDTACREAITSLSADHPNVFGWVSTSDEFIRARLLWIPAAF